MKIAQHTNVEEVLGVQKQHKFKITDQSQAIIMDSLINLYSDPIGSIVREITSNCIDANRERDLKIDGKIPMEGDDDQTFWSSKQAVGIEYVEKNIILGIDECMMFHDHGCGLSEERVSNVFTTFGASTKRDNNYEIGGFGLGAKSPLAYTETFYVRSRHNGTETYYMLYRNNDNVPHMDQVYQTSTEEKNGSTVIVPIKEHYDKSKFRDAISDQLCFFDNIMFTNVVEALGGVIQYYAKDSSVKAIHETDDYVLTNNGKNVDLLIGKVVYPLNWDLLEADEYENNASMCIKFDIGVLDLVPSRESIRYTPKTIAAIDAKIKAIRESFVKDVGEQYKGITNYVNFIKSIGNITPSSRWSTLTSNDPLAIKASAVKIKMTDIPFTPIPSISPTSVASGGAFHKVFDGVHFYKVSFSRNSKAIGGQTISRVEISTYEELSRKLSEHDKLYHVENNFSTAKEAALLSKGEFLCFKADASKFGARLNTRNHITDSRPEWRKTTTFNAILKHLKASDMYADYEAVEELEVDESFGVVLDNKSRRKINKEVFARRAYIDSGFRSEVKYNNYEYKISKLQEEIEDEDCALEYIVYAEACDEEWLKKAVQVVSSTDANRESRYYSDTYDVKSHVLCFKVAKNVAKDFKKLEGFINAKDLIMDTKNHGKLTKFCTAHKINQMSASVAFLSNFGDLHPDLYSKYKALKAWERDNIWSAWASEIDNLVLEIFNVEGVDEKVLINQEMASNMLETAEYADSIQLLNHVSFHSREVWDCVRDFLSLKGKQFESKAVVETTEDE